MARGQIGNLTGFAAVDQGAKIAEITADGANTVTVSVADARKLRVGQTIDFLVKAGGAVLANSRVIEAINATTGVITYSGADAATVAGTHAVYQAGSYRTANAAQDSQNNFNGGAGSGSGFALPADDTIDEMRSRLKAIAAGTYTDAQLDLMTMNDMMYAIRLSEAPGSIK